jgi:ribosomal protein S4E
MARDNGRNVLVEKDTYKTGDTLKIELPTQKILAHHPLAKGATAMVIGGSHTGSMGASSSTSPTASTRRLHRLPKSCPASTIRSYAV